MGAREQMDRGAGNNHGRIKTMNSRNYWAGKSDTRWGSVNAIAGSRKYDHSSPGREAQDLEERDFEPQSAGKGKRIGIAAKAESRKRNKTMRVVESREMSGVHSQFEAPAVHPKWEGGVGSGRKTILKVAWLIWNRERV